LIGVREVTNGVLYSYRLRPLVTAGIFILLTRAVIHPAFYSLDDLESLHFLGPAVPQPSHDPVLIVWSKGIYPHTNLWRLAKGNLGPHQ